MLNKPVIVLDGGSSKFHKLPAEVLTIPTPEFERDPTGAIEQARDVHTRQSNSARNLLQEAREANLAFARDVSTTLSVKNLSPAGPSTS